MVLKSSRGGIGKMMQGLLFRKILDFSLAGCCSIFIVFAARLILIKCKRKYAYYLWFVVFLNLCIPFLANGIYNFIPKQAAVISIIEFLKNIPQFLKIAQIVWFMGMFGIFLYSIFCVMHVKMQIQEAVIVRWDAKKRIANVQGISSPFLWGIFKPILYLPVHLPSEEKKYMTAHAYYHKKRKDYLVRLLCFIITVIYWFHPLVWVAYFLMCKDMEISCDEEVLTHISGVIRKRYALSLLNFTEKQDGFMKIPFFLAEFSIKARVKNVLCFHKKRKVVSAFGLILMVGIAFGLMFFPALIKIKEGRNQSSELFATEKEENIMQALVSNKQDNMMSTLIAEEKNQNINSSQEFFNENTGENKTDYLTEVVNNGGKVIQVKESLYYKKGLPLYSDGSYLYASHKEDSIQDTFRYDLEGNGYVKLFNGIIVDCNNTGEILYYIANETNSNQIPGSFYAYNTSNRQSYLLAAGSFTYLDRKDGYLYVARQEADGIEIDSISETDGTVEKNILHQTLKVQQITSFYIDDTYILLAAGSYEGVLHFFSGEFYSYRRAAKELSKVHCTDADSFQVADNHVYYFKSEHGGLYRSNFDFQEEEAVGSNYLDVIAWDKASNTLLVSKNVGRNNYLSNLVRINPDGSNERDVLRVDQFNLKMHDYDKIRFSEISLIEDTIYVKVQQWGFRGKLNFWDNLIWEQYYQVSADGRSQALWSP